jgi:bifunctional DNase/RNase
MSDATPDPTVTGEPDVPGEPAPTFAVMLMGAVTFELPSPAPLVSLIEQSVPYRELSIPVGLPEAQALAQAIGGVSGARPGTHELFAETLRRTQTEVVAARITRYENGLYFAELDLMTPRGRVVLDSRVTDALILAVRQAIHAPILCDVRVLEAASVK